MKEISKGSKEYLEAKEKAINVIFYNSLNKSLTESGGIYAEAWNFLSARLFYNTGCYVLMIGAGCWFRWSA